MPVISTGPLLQQNDGSDGLRQQEPRRKRNLDSRHRRLHDIAFARDIADHVLLMDAGTTPSTDRPMRSWCARPIRALKPFAAAFTKRGRGDPPADQSASAD